MKKITFLEDIYFILAIGFFVTCLVFQMTFLTKRGLGIVLAIILTTISYYLIWDYTHQLETWFNNADWFLK